MIRFKLKWDHRIKMQKRFATTFLAIALVAVMMVGMQSEYADALKAQGKHNQMYGSATKNIVCGDRLCSEPETPEQTPVTPKQTPATPEPKKTTGTCNKSTIQLKTSCTSFSINGGTVNGSVFDNASESTTIQIHAQNDGSITINTALNSAFILVDGEEWDDVIVSGSSTTIEFLAGTQTIEIFGN